MNRLFSIIKIFFPLALIVVFLVLTFKTFSLTASGSAFAVHASRTHHNILDFIVLKSAQDQFAVDNRSHWERKEELDARLNDIYAEMELRKAELEVFANLLSIKQCLNTQELISELDKAEPIKVQALLTKLHAYKKLTHDELLKEYGDVFGKRFNSSTTVYIIEGRTSSGRHTQGGSVAVDPNFVSLGTRLLCLNLGKVFRADDTGGKVAGTITDIFINDTYFNALRWGRRNTEWIVLDNGKIKQQYNSAIDTIARYTNNHKEAEMLLATGKSNVIDTILDIADIEISEE